MQEILEDFIADVDELIGPSASDAVQDPKLFYRIHMSHNDGNPNQPSTSDLNRMYNATKYITRRRGKS